MSGSGGYIYVLTNPSFPEYVKIGYADNVDDRVAQLNRSECTPFAFRKYAILHVASRLADKNIHKLIDTFKPELRAKENVNGKMRVREFFSMSASEAVDLLTTIGDIYGETPQIFAQTETEKQEQIIAEKVSAASERKSPFSFYKCGINDGAQIVYVNDPTIICTVVGDRKIQYHDKTTSLSALAKELLNCNSSVQGTLYFSYKGELLSALRKRLEDEGNYIDNPVKVDSEKNLKNQNEVNEEDFLYFNSTKYNAKCKRTDKGYLLLKGSEIAPKLSVSCRKKISDMRKEYKYAISEKSILLQDIFFPSSSAAAMFVSGTSLNGKISWKNKDGVLLKDIEK